MDRTVILCKKILNIVQCEVLMARDSLRRPADPRQAMIDAAERAIASGGLEALSVRRIATETGVSIGRVSYIFGSLDGLVLEVNARTLDALATAFDQLVAQRGAGSGRLLAVALFYFHFAETERPRWEALFRHRMRDQEPVPDWYVARRADMLGRVATLISAAVSSPDSMRRARTVFEAVHGVVSLGVDRKLGGTQAEVIRRLECLVEMIEP
ncbi:TetR/AcrR family transcriptional regulator [Acidisoma cladoniae]|jgi:AcrR family transcriptional regulator|uniref:TetR/AcrR family transcriptional regulator n=1 Tax=Acidisoma cladoniae TaxID=3040935 RepID=UPI002551B42D|nr:TetR family transcriptional regulator [Acidisoma sp. PAMC 29798]